MIMSYCSCGVEVREQCDEYQTVQLSGASILAAQLHGRLYVVSTVRGRERYANFCRVLVNGWVGA